MIRLYTSYYREANRDRDAEFRTCLERNLDCAAIDRILVLNEGGDLSKLRSDKLTVRDTKARPTYDDFFGWVNDTTGKNDINIIANTDIYFDDGISILEEADLTNRCLALSRWDAQGDGTARLLELDDSQDAWIFQGRIKDIQGDFHLGIRRCDGRIAYEIRRAGYRLQNPCYTLKAFHLHVTDYRTYEQTDRMLMIPSPFRSVPQCNLFPVWRHAWLRHARRRPLPPYRWAFGARLRRLRQRIGSISPRFRRILKSLPLAAKVASLWKGAFRRWVPVTTPSAIEVLRKVAEANGEPWRFVHVGANDGVTDERFFPLIREYGWRGVAAEPVQSTFEALRVNCGDLTGVELLNVAVADCDGEAEMYYHEYGTPYHHLSTLKREVLSHYRWESIPDIENHVKMGKVPCVSLNTLFERIGFVPDVLRLDVVGMEYEVLRALDFARSGPKAILFSPTHLRENYKSAFRLLRSKGYFVLKDSRDALALRRELRRALGREITAAEVGTSGCAAPSSRLANNAT